MNKIILKRLRLITIICLIHNDILIYLPKKDNSNNFTTIIHQVYKFYIYFLN